MRRFRDTKYYATKEGGIVNAKTNKKLKPYIDKGYERVCLSINNVQRKYYVHRIVAECYLGYSSLTVDHINEDKRNNNIINLQYLSQSENASKSRKNKELPMYISRYLKRGYKNMYKYCRRIDGKNKQLKTSLSLDVILEFKKTYEANN